MKRMRVTSKGQVTIPREIRDRMGITPQSEVEFTVEEGQVILRKTRSGKPRGDQLVRRLRGRATVRMTTDQIMELTRG